MTPPDPFRCAVVAAKGRIILRQGPWGHEITVSDYPRWLAMYRALRDRDKGRFARFYAQPVQALEAIAGKVREAAGV